MKEKPITFDEILNIVGMETTHLHYQYLFQDLYYQMVLYLFFSFCKMSPDPKETLNNFVKNWKDNQKDIHEKQRELILEKAINQPEDETKKILAKFDSIFEENINTVVSSLNTARKML